MKAVLRNYFIVHFFVVSKMKNNIIKNAILDDKEKTKNIRVKVCTKKKLKQSGTGIKRKP